eukprot:CAMPEP_0197452310 /NCGR_PEP_ID=MMETSP1175-20131217/31774_1 /TAXON_ID=1003142 /ORGANISM="Triceratium dubium, Strain CCMP147" /LENGTH=388 /DNA_ID=CAMNT_0042985291 /DNA_START=38 /DNA_END=1204 /DNA_ORIENTATION=+
MSDKSCDHPKKKKARYGLALEIELSVPFLAAGDLSQLAAVSRAGRDTARASYLSRIHAPFALPVGEKGIANAAPSVFWDHEAPACYTSPPGKRCFSSSEINIQYFLLFREDGSWTLRPRNNKKDPDSDRILALLDEKPFHLPDHRRFSKDTDIMHCSLTNNLLVVVFCKNSSADLGENNGIVHDDGNLRKELWGAVYEIKREKVAHQPSFLHSLGPRVGPDVFGGLNTVDFGSSFRSANGRVLAIVTSLPGEENSSLEASITIYDVSPEALKERSNFSVPCGDHYDSSSIDVSLSMGGEIASVKTEMSYHEAGYLGVFDLQAKPCKALFEVADLWEFGSVEEQYFTPDNEFVLHLSSEVDQDEFIENELNREDFPHFAKRIIVLKSGE